VRPDFTVHQRRIVVVGAPEQETDKAKKVRR
jgi:hypothetical protein